ncbi:serine hydrolase [Patescibacteria group bacterium]|nr:serine hydrolase [Patescibacteria group bacterium]
MIKEHIKPALFGAGTALILGMSFILISNKYGLAKNSFENLNFHESSPILNPDYALMVDTFSQEMVPQTELSYPSFSDLLSQVTSKEGTYSIYIKHLVTGDTYEHNSQALIYGASLYKLLVGGAVYDLISQDKLSLNYEYTYEHQDFTGGTGVIQTQSVGTQYSVEQLLNYLFKDSDNIAQNILVRNIGNNTISSFYDRISDPNASSGQFFLSGRTTAKEVAHILINIHQTEDWSRTNKRLYFNHMLGTSFDDRISVGLSDSLIFAHKIGNWPNGIYHDCGMVFDSSFSNPVAVCLLAEQVDFEEFLDVSRWVGRFVSSLY